MGHGDAFKRFTEAAAKHVAETDSGHYGGKAIQPLDFMEQYFGDDALAWQVVKYACRYPRTRNEKDLLKAAHYLSRLWVINHGDG